MLVTRIVGRRNGWSMITVTIQAGQIIGCLIRKSIDIIQLKNCFKVLSP